MAEQVKIGKLAEASAERDAIHIAIAPVVAGELGLRPGTLIGFSEPGNEVVRARLDGIGIVDPFLKIAPNKGERFYMFLLPNTITSLRHHWAHPAFTVDPVRDVTTSELWLRKFASEIHRDYDVLLEIGRGAIVNGSAYAGDDDDQDTLNEHKREFLWHVASVLGLCPPDPEDVYFSCAC